MGKSLNKKLYILYKEGKLEEYSDNTCIICMDEQLDNSYVLTNCGHKFCVKCFTLHIRLKSDCPICRTLITNKLPIPAVKDIIPYIIEDIVTRNIHVDMPLNIFKWYSWFKGDYLLRTKRKIINICNYAIESVLFHEDGMLHDED